jgi:hypothetical protein
MATEMAGRLTAQEGAQIAARCILWSDEATFHTGGFVNRQLPLLGDTRSRSDSGEDAKSPKVTVWCGMTATRVIGAYLLLDTMNAERYLQMLEDYVWPILSGW